MAAFAVLFGTRHIDATEHQDGLMVAIATESVVKLVAFLAQPTTRSGTKGKQPYDRTDTPRSR
jgi:Na+/proline symporter